MTKGPFDDADIKIPCPGCGKTNKQTVGWLRNHSQGSCRERRCCHQSVTGKLGRHHLARYRVEPTRRAVRAVKAILDELINFQREHCPALIAGQP
jgi:hypothetical protein